MGIQIFSCPTLNKTSFSTIPSRRFGSPSNNYPPFHRGKCFITRSSCFSKIFSLKTVFFCSYIVLYHFRDFSQHCPHNTSHILKPKLYQLWDISYSIIPNTPHCFVRKHKLLIIKINCNKKRHC